MAEPSLTMVPHGDSMIVAVSGELDFVTSGQFDESLSKASAGSDVVILDLSALDFIDTTCLAVIVRHAKQQASTGGSLLLAGARPDYVRALWITGLASWLPMHASVAEALAASGSGSAGQAGPAGPDGDRQSAGSAVGCHNEVPRSS